MEKSCFVIMGFGIKNNINLDLTYQNIIKPCIIDNNLVPVSLYKENQFNAYRADEIIGNASIDYKFVICLAEADIVIADISTMNINAIYELGARHALKPKSTIILCSEDKKKKFNFFDLNYVPIIFYKHDGDIISNEEINHTKQKLNSAITFAKTSESDLPDNPIQRALFEKNIYKKIARNVEENLYATYLKARKLLDNEEYEAAEKMLTKLYNLDNSEENLILLVLAKYKNAENKNSIKGLIESLDFINEHADTINSTSEYLFGRIAAIALRIFNLTKDTRYYYIALENYRKGSSFSKINLYCPRNYCALLLRIYEITDDKNIIKEYFYTAKHYSKIFINMNVSAQSNYNYEQLVYYKYNCLDLISIKDGNYNNYEKIKIDLSNNMELTKRQKKTIIDGINKLKEDIDKINEKLNLL